MRKLSGRWSVNGIMLIGRYLENKVEREVRKRLKGECQLNNVKRKVSGEYSGGRSEHIECSWGVSYLENTIWRNRVGGNVNRERQWKVPGPIGKNASWNLNTSGRMLRVEWNQLNENWTLPGRMEWERNVPGQENQLDESLDHSGRLLRGRGIIFLSPGPLRKNTSREGGGGQLNEK